MLEVVPAVSRLSILGLWAPASQDGQESLAVEQLPSGCRLSAKPLGLVARVVLIDIRHIHLRAG